MALKFSKFLNYSLTFFFFLIVIVSLNQSFIYIKDFNFSDVIFILFFILSSFLIYLSIKKNINPYKIILLIMILSFLIRLLWILSINSVPFSDFSGIYENGKSVLQGNFEIFKGSHYYGRFPHLTITVLYFALIRIFFPNPLFAIKFINVIFSTITVFLCYLIAKEVFNSHKKAIIAAYISAIYPPLIIYTAVTCSENMAIPFFLISIYIFILAIKNKKKIYYLILSALTLSIGNLFRMVGAIIIIAYIIYLLIYFKESKKKILLSIISLIMGFYIPLILVSKSLILSGITEFPLWQGSESKWTSILKGSNINSFGRWNKEDADIIDVYPNNYKKTEDLCKSIIKNRLLNTPTYKLAQFYVRKYVMQWSNGDFGGIYWANGDLKKESLKIDLYSGGIFSIQLFYFFIVLLSFIGIYKNKYNLRNYLINLFYIIFCGYGLMFLIIESQDRYSFIASWIFIILSITAFEGSEIFEKNK